MRLAVRRFFRRDPGPARPLDSDERYAELRAGFGAAASHELRTPLARILALLDSAALPGADAGALIDQARREVERAVEVIDEVLFLSELDLGQPTIASGSTRVAAVAAEVFSELRERAERADVELRADIEPDFELPLRRRLVRILVENLAENAIRHAGSGSVFTLGAGSDHGHLVLTGTDTGGGVRRGDLARIFERFYRADSARASPGTGLGLAVVKHIATAIGGDVEAQSRPGGGLVVRCVFPRA
jgi:signal transduction histidine kinase